MPVRMASKVVVDSYVNSSIIERERKV